MTSHATVPADTPVDISPEASLPGKTVHFDLPPEDHEAEQAQREKPRRRRRKCRQEPGYEPRAVFGLHFTDELVHDVGLFYAPQDWKDNPTKHTPGLIDDHGREYASAYCRRMFPDIPLRWWHTVLADVKENDLGLQPILVLGHIDRRGKIVLDVDIADLNHMREVLGLADQEPEWYDVMHVFY